MFHAWNLPRYEAFTALAPEFMRVHAGAGVQGGESTVSVADSVTADLPSGC